MANLTLSLFLFFFSPVPDISEYFLDLIKAEFSPAIAAMMALMESLKRDESTTLQEFIGDY